VEAAFSCGRQRSFQDGDLANPLASRVLTDQWLAVLATPVLLPATGRAEGGRVQVRPSDQSCQMTESLSTCTRALSGPHSGSDAYTITATAKIGKTIAVVAVAVG
jgi:hypothetical protein